MPDMKAVAGASRACSRCGAQVTVQEGAEFQCPFCGHQERFITVARSVRSYPIEMVSRLRRQFANQVPPSAFECSQCGGQSRERALATLCRYCRGPLVADVKASPLIAPEALLRFEMDESMARQAIRQWIKDRAFAPNTLRKVADAENMASWYLPYWVFDMQINARYEGTGAYSRMTSAGKELVWQRVSGTASQQMTGVAHEVSSMAARVNAVVMGFRLDEAQPFQSDLLRGHRAPYYEVEPEQSFTALQSLVNDHAVEIVKRDIGGEIQVVSGYQYWTTGVKFRLAYLPVWACSYAYRGKTWPILVNGHSGVVSGSRPFSRIKIAAAALVALVILPSPVVVAAILFGSLAIVVAIVEFFGLVSLEAYVNKGRCVKGVFAAISDACFGPSRPKSST